ncbi:hypothetical protein P885DRAFT_78871 [Corynascus similis CBS 632.67]
MANVGFTSGPNPTLAPRGVSLKHPTDMRLRIKSDQVVLDHSFFKKYRYADKDDNAKELVYAVGDNKLMQKWKSAWLRLRESACKVNTDPPYHPPGIPAKSHQKTMDVALDRVKPLRQLATHCRYGET